MKYAILLNRVLVGKIFWGCWGSYKYFTLVYFYTSKLNFQYQIWLFDILTNSFIPEVPWAMKYSNLSDNIKITKK